MIVESKNVVYVCDDVVATDLRISLIWYVAAFDIFRTWDA
jgi:hypothetical protein